MHLVDESDAVPLTSVDELVAYFRGAVSGQGIKLNLDGSIQGKTGYLTQPYKEPPPGAATNYRRARQFPDGQGGRRL